MLCQASIDLTSSMLCQASIKDAADPNRKKCFSSAAISWVLAINKVLVVRKASPMPKMGFQAPSLSLFVFLALHCLFMVPLQVQASSKLYIVYMGERQHEDPNLVTASHHDILTSLLGSKEEALGSIIYSYRHGFSGFAAKLTESQAKQISGLPGIISVKPSRNYRLHTTRSMDFLGLNQNQPTGLLEKSNLGEGVIIGMIDTGIWPESRSFNDEGYGPIPSRWKGKCELAPSFGANNCSRKIIGARWYTGDIDTNIVKEDYLSPRDFNGHGSHTASTAAGSIVEKVSFHGLAGGIARGGAPSARLAIYKACWGSEGICGQAGVLKAIDDAIHDGVDVLSLSIGGDGYPSGSLHAVAKGITVVFSAGNDGPLPQTVGNALPWVITVAASTIDRSFPTIITLGDNQRLVSQSIFNSSEEGTKFTELFYNASCNTDNLNSTDVAGKIVLCYDSSAAVSSPPSSQFNAALVNVLQAGGKGIIFAQYTTNLLEFSQACLGIVPCVFVDYEIANKISNYILSASSPMAKVSPTRNVVGGKVWSPRVAAFSSRGPSPTFPGLLKPDIAAPGVCILAVKNKGVYNFDSGTSMACPHVSGVVALLKSLHPNWSPAAIKSAIVTTASITDRYGIPIEAEGVPRKLADPFDYGGGNINPERAANPGLIYDIDPKDYRKFFNCTFDPSVTCGALLKPLYYLNLPSISIPDLKETVTVFRTVTNVGEVYAMYKAVLEPPPGIRMVVEPSVLVFNATTNVSSFKVTFTSTRKVQGGYTFGSLTWQNSGTHSVRIPIAVRTVIQDFYADTS